MKKVKMTTLMSTLLTTILCMTALISMSGCGKKYQEIALYKYTENTDGTLTITELTDKGKSEYELTVPSVLDGKNVSAIGDGAFRDDTFIRKVVIEDGIEYIGSNAFLSCYNLTDIDIPESVTDIGMNAFTQTAWHETQMASSKDIVINNILCEADSEQENYTVRDGVVTISSGVFYNNMVLKKVDFPSSLKKIGANAFAGCKNLTEVVLPDGLESLGYGVFADSGIKEINIPKSVKNIGQDAFLGIDKVNMNR